MRVQIDITGQQGEGKTLLAQALESFLSKYELPSGSEVVCFTHQTKNKFEGGLEFGWRVR